MFQILCSARYCELCITFRTSSNPKSGPDQSQHRHYDLIEVRRYGARLPNEVEDDDGRLCVVTECMQFSSDRDPGAIITSLDQFFFLILLFDFVVLTLLDPSRRANR